ncbi:MAG: hypothetical protein KIT83_05460 [Bryobacterales bacterium]|nr:hypothetical protein [Bryobacterales bacterium]
MERRCGFLGYDASSEHHPVWARGGLVLGQCPKPLVSAQSFALLVAYSWWRRSGSMLDPQIRAKSVDAFQLIDQLRQTSHAEHAERDRAGKD